MLQKGSMVLDNVVFELNPNKDSKFYIFNSAEKKGTFEISFDIDFKTNQYQMMYVSPSISNN